MKRQTKNKLIGGLYFLLGWILIFPLTDQSLKSWILVGIGTIVIGIAEQYFIKGNNNVE